MPTTIKEVAAACGLSITTVSLVLNNKPNRIPELRKKLIIETAQMMNYHPSHIAVSLITKRTTTIGLILPDIKNVYFSQLAQAIEEECALSGYTILYGNTSEDPLRDLAYTSIFLGRGVDAIIVIRSNSLTHAQQSQLLAIAQDSDTPVLAVDRSFFDGTAPSVMLDQFAGGRAATQYLLALGHRRIGCITGPLDSGSGAERLRGYQAALADAHIAPNHDLIFSGNFQAEDGLAALPSLLAHGATAIFACNDMMAMGVYSACRKVGISIPAQLSVVGFDDVFYAEYMTPPLTTVAQPVREIGQEAARQVLELVAQKSPDGKKTTFMPQLLMRESAAPPSTGEVTPCY